MPTSIYLEFGADEHIEGIGNEEKVRRIRARAIKAGLKLVDCPIRHMGTEKAHDVYLGIEHYLMDNGVEMLLRHRMPRPHNGGRRLPRRVPQRTVKKDFEIRAEHTVVATGRRGADWLEKICSEHGVAAPAQHRRYRRACRGAQRDHGGDKRRPLRVEAHRLPEALQEQGAHLLPEPRRLWSARRTTTTTSPSSTVTPSRAPTSRARNTNVAILCSHNFSVPFNQPIAYAQKVGELTNMLANGHILVQRFGDILDGKRTWEKELAQTPTSSPTLRGRRRGRHHRRDALPRDDKHHQLHSSRWTMVVPGFASL